MSFQGTVTIGKSSLKHMRDAIEALPREMRRSAAAATIRAGAKPILSAMKSKVPVKTGLLRKSLGTKSKSFLYGQGNIMAFALIGPRRGFKSSTNLTGRKRKPRKAKGKRSTFIERKMIEADEYAWYLEMGTPKMSAKPFIRPAIDSSQGQVFDAMAAGLEKHLDRVASRLRRKGVGR